MKVFYCGITKWTPDEYIRSLRLVRLKPEFFLDCVSLKLSI